MRILRLLAAFAFAGAETMPIAPRAGLAILPTQAELVTAFKAARPSFDQRRAMKSLLATYECESAAADDAAANAKAPAAKLGAGLRAILTPLQRAAFARSIAAQSDAAPLVRVAVRRVSGTGD